MESQWSWIMKLEIEIAKEAYDALAEPLKEAYILGQTGKYELEGVASIQRALEAEKAKKATKPELLTELEELKKFKAEHEADQQKAAQADLEAKGKYDEAMAAKEKAWNERFEAEKVEKESLFADVKRERLTNELVKRGALPDRAGYLVNELDIEIDLVKDESGYTLKKKGGIGDATEFDAVIEAAKTKTPFFFAATNASGSGASGSTGNGSGTTVKTATKEQVKAMDPAAKREFYLNDGVVTDR
jgi:hypothetical protein